MRDADTPPRRVSSRLRPPTANGTRVVWSGAGARLALESRIRSRRNRRAVTRAAPRNGTARERRTRPHSNEFADALIADSARSTEYRRGAQYPVRSVDGAARPRFARLRASSARDTSFDRQRSTPRPRALLTLSFPAATRHRGVGGWWGGVG